MEVEGVFLNVVIYSVIILGYGRLGDVEYVFLFFNINFNSVFIFVV